MIDPSDYEKRHYDVTLKDGTLVKGCWPNAGRYGSFYNRGGAKKNTYYTIDQIEKVEPTSEDDFRKLMAGKMFSDGSEP